MPVHVEAAYKDAADNIVFLKRQQWLATNYVLLLYAAIFVIAAHYFSRTDVTRNWLRVLTTAAFGPLVYAALISTRNREISESPWLDLQDLFQRRGACWIGCEAGTIPIGINRRFTLAS